MLIVLSRILSCLRTAKKKDKSDSYDCLSSSSSSASALSSSSSSSSSQMSTNASFSETPALIYRNALHVAVAYDAEDVVRLLLRHDVDPESIGVFNQVGAFENDNNNCNNNALLQQSSRTPVYAENVNYANSSSEMVLEESTSASSRSGSNTSSTNRLSCPLHILPKSLKSKSGSTTSSPRSVQISSQRYSAETSPLRSSVATHSNVTRADIHLSSVQKSDGNDLGKLRLFRNSASVAGNLTARVCHSTRYGPR